MDDLVFNQGMAAEVIQSSLLNILILSWEYPPNIVGGLSRHVSGLSIHLAGLGLNVHVLTTGNGDHPSYERINHVHVHRVKPLNEQDRDFFSWIGGLNLAIAQKASELLGDLRFDVIHVHDWLVGAAGIVLKELYLLPLLTTIHGTEHGRNGGIHNEIQRFIHEKEKQLIERSDQIIICSKYMEHELITIFNAQKEKMTVIPNGIDVEKRVIKSGEVFQKLNDKKIIFSIGRMVEEKGFKTMIKAASRVKDRGLNLLFVIAGKGPMLEPYRQEVIRKRLQEEIVFIGYITDEERDSYILHSDITVFPSLYEPFGIVALESMILEKPTIVSNTGGLKGTVMHMKTGLLMDPGNAESLLEQITFLLENPVKAAEIGLQGKKMVKGIINRKDIAVSFDIKPRKKLTPPKINDNFDRVETYVNSNHIEMISKRK
jgi:1,4-alpha-glucan branching enzyme